MSTTTTAFTTCPLCEATCGLEVAVDGDRVTRIRGDRDDVFSQGYLCPKGSTLRHLHEDPDRLRTPLRRDGELVPATWAEAFAEVERRLVPIIEEHGRDAVAVYLGNPIAHNLAGLLYVRPLIKAIGTRNLYSASTVDQRPKEIATALLFGAMQGFAVPDLDRTSHLFMLGANPFASNGSLATAPDWPGRLRAIRERGGAVVVVDPVRTRTVEEVASEHVVIRPGTDAHLLMAMVQVLVADGLVDLGPAAPFMTGVDEVARVAAPFTPEVVGPVCGVDAATIRRLAHELAAAPTAAVYGRIGTCTQEFGTVASWLVDVLNVLTGNLDREGGVMFATPAAGGSTTSGTPRVGRATKLGRWTSRVRGMPETLGELPVSCLAEEIDTPGPGQVRALLTIAGNPALSTPNSDRLRAALPLLDFMVSVDIYCNETTSHADVILPPPSALQRSHYDLGFYQFALRNVANYSPPVLPLDDGAVEEWRILATLIAIAQGMGASTDPAVVDDALAAMAAAASGDAETMLAAVAPRVGPERLLDVLLRTGPYGLTLDKLLDHPHGIDLGPLVPRLPDSLRTPSGMVELAPEPIVADVARLAASLDRRRAAPFVLVGRRHLRSNNSWMHNVEVLVKGKPRCTLQVHPDDAAELGLNDGGTARVSSRVGSVVAPVEVTDAVGRGVVSLPHGWGHDADGVVMGVARAHAGVNSNVLTDETAVDPLSGNAVLNGIPVTIVPEELP